jgi:hypothetical protein
MMTGSLAATHWCTWPGLWSLPVFLGKFAKKQLQRFLGVCSKMNHLSGNIANT